MYRLFLALVATVMLCSSVLAADPPPDAYHSYAALQIIEKDILVVEVDNHFFGKIDQGGYIRTFSLCQFPNSKSPGILQLLKDNVGEVIRVECLEFQDFTRNVQNNDGMLLFSAKVVPAE